MKKSIVLSVALCLWVGLTSCDDKVTKWDIKGKWQFSKITVSVHGGPADFEDFLSNYANNHIQIDPDATYTFKANKTGIYTYSEANATVSENFSYSLTGNSILTIVMDHDPSDVRTENIESITRWEMVWSVDITDDVNAALEFPSAFTKVLAHVRYDRK